jgi:hypothetical protein
MLCANDDDISSDTNHDATTADISHAEHLVDALTRNRRREVEEERRPEMDVRAERTRRFLKGQDEEKWIWCMKEYLHGRLEALTQEEARNCGKIAEKFALGANGLLYYVNEKKEESREEDLTLRLVIPTTMRNDVLHHYHSSLEGGHQGIVRTYAKMRKGCYWRGMYGDVCRYIGECVDCETGKGKPTNVGRSPGNVIATYPFQAIAMDHIPSLPKSYKGNTELLVWVDLFSGFVIMKASSSRTAQTVAEAYEECVFRRFGASEVIRHDREPGFMSDFFHEFSKIVGQKQRATMAYRPQANGAAERMVQTIVRAIKMYVKDLDQKDWDEYAERLAFALNSSFDRTRQETPFFLIHGWDPRSTLETMLPAAGKTGSTKDPRKWRFRIQTQYSYARSQANKLVKEAIQDRADKNNEKTSKKSLDLEVGTQVWLYLDRVKVGYAKKLAHLWHGPFRVVQVIEGHAVKLEIAGKDYKIFPIVHVSKLKLRKIYPNRPVEKLVNENEARFDFDEALLPEDSWIPPVESGVFEVEEILEVRDTKRARYGRHEREYLVRWKDHDAKANSWVKEDDLRCGSLLFEFQEKVKAANRFNVMQSTDA